MYISPKFFELKQHFKKKSRPFWYYDKKNSNVNKFMIKKILKFVVKNNIFPTDLFLHLSIYFISECKTYIKYIDIK